MTKPTPKFGDIILFKSKKGWFSWAQRFFTRMPYTHTAICNEDGDELLVMGAEIAFVVEPWEKVLAEGSEYEIFRPRTLYFNSKKKYEAVKFVFMRYAGDVYGFFQILWFVYRWFAERFLKKDVRKQKNWFPNNPICSEAGWWYLHELLKGAPNALEVIEQWNADTAHSGDMWRMLTHPEVAIYFERIISDERIAKTATIVQR